MGHPRARAVPGHRRHRSRHGDRALRPGPPRRLQAPRAGSVRRPGASLAAHPQTKTLFTSSVFDGLAANAPALRSLVAGSRLADLGLLDRSRISADLESGIAGGTPPLGALHALLVTELWLARLETAARFTAWWQPAPDRSPQP